MIENLIFGLDYFLSLVLFLLFVTFLGSIFVIFAFSFVLILNMNKKGEIRWGVFS